MGYIVHRVAKSQKWLKQQYELYAEHRYMKVVCTWHTLHVYYLQSSQYPLETHTIISILQMRNLGSEKSQLVSDWHSEQ